MQFFVLITRGVYNIGDSVPGSAHGATAWDMMRNFSSKTPDFLIRIIDKDQCVEDSVAEARDIFSAPWSSGHEMESSSLRIGTGGGIFSGL
jgi:hypothetical protein